MFLRKSNIFDDFETVFDNFFNTSLFDLHTSTSRASIKNKDDLIIIKFGMPGIDKSNLIISLNGNLLRIKYDSTKDKDSWLESFNQTINLPSNIDEDAISATYNKGILAIKIPKNVVEKTNGKRIEVT